MILLWVLAALVLLFGLAAFFGAPYVPSQRRFVKKAFQDLYPLKKTDVLVDIGCGDGLLLCQARHQGAKAIGYEINPALFAIASWISRRDDGVSVRFANFWMTDLPQDTTVVYAFSVKRDNPRLVRKLQKESERLGRPLSLLCFGSPLEQKTPDAQDGAYYLYTFYPMQDK